MTHHVQKYGFETELGLTSDPGNEVDFQLATVCHAVYFPKVDRFTKTSILLERRLFNLPLEKPFDLFDKVVIPVLLYGCEIWF